MAKAPVILALSGSTRTASHNTALLRLGMQCMQQAGAQVRAVDLAGFDLPIYNGDLESRSGLPGPAIELRRLFKEADGFFLASPEHNMSVSALLKNALDWVSRPHRGESGRAVFEGRTAALCSASTGVLGGQRGLMHLRLVLSGLGVHVLPAVVGVGSAAQAFDAEGRLKDGNQTSALQALAQSMVQVTRRLRGADHGDKE